MPLDALESIVYPLLPRIGLFLPLHRALPTTRQPSTPTVRHRQVHQQGQLTPPSATEHLGTLGREPPALPPPWDQPSAARQFGRARSDPPHASRYVRSACQSPKEIRIRQHVAPDFKDKTRYKLYMSPGSQISHTATNKGNIKRQYLLHNVLVKEK